jgi:hypothetical protein
MNLQMELTSSLPLGEQLIESDGVVGGIKIDCHIQKKDENDAIIWQFSSLGRYYVQSLYAVIDDRGVKQIYTLLMWKIHVPPRIHVFLWLLVNNKILTMDNLAKRKDVDDKSCLFSSLCKKLKSETQIGDARKGDRL